MMCHVFGNGDAADEERMTRIPSPSLMSGECSEQNGQVNVRIVWMVLDIELASEVGVGPES